MHLAKVHLACLFRQCGDVLGSNPPKENFALLSPHLTLLPLSKVFNVGDMVGKLLPHFRLAPGQTACLLLSLSRIVFIPAFYCAARFGAPAAVMAILTLLLGLSNGWVAGRLKRRDQAFDTDSRTNRVAGVSQRLPALTKQVDHVAGLRRGS